MIFVAITDLQIYIIFTFLKALHCIRSLPLPRPKMKYYTKITCISTHTFALCFSSKRDCRGFSTARKTDEII